MRDLFLGVFGVSFGVILAVLLKLEGVSYFICVVGSMFVCAYLFSNKNFNKCKVKSEYGFIRPAMAYKVDLHIRVNPKAIFGEDFKEDADGLRRIQKIIEDPEIEVDKERSFLGNYYHFTLIRDELSGLSLIYDVNDKIFIDEIAIYGSFLSCNATKFKQKYSIESSLVNSSLVIEDCAIGYRDKIAPFAGMDKPLSYGIPTDMIIEALTRLKVYWGNPMYAVKKFNKELQEYLDKEKIKYDTSNVDDLGIGIEFQGKGMDKKYALRIKKHTGLELYDEKLYSHTFEGKHIIASIAVKFMDKTEFV